MPFIRFSPTLGGEVLLSSSSAREGRYGSIWSLVLPSLRDQQESQRSPQKLDHMCLGGLTCPPALFFGSASFLIKLVSAELGKQ